MLKCQVTEVPGTDSTTLAERKTAQDGAETFGKAFAGVGTSIRHLAIHLPIHRLVLIGAILLGGLRAQAAAPAVQSKNPTGADLGIRYSYTLTASNGTPPYSAWTITSGSLPPGLSLNTATGAVTGTVTATAVITGTAPTTAATGSYSFSVTVKDSANQVSNARALTLAVSAPVSISPPAALLQANATAPYTPFFFTGMNGTMPYTWSATGLPQGMSIGQNGALSGTPIEGSDGIYNPQFKLADTDGSSATVTLPLTVAGNDPLSVVTTSPLSAGIVGTTYPEQILTAAGGEPPYTFAITSGTLPAGLSLSKGNIVGTPTTVQTSTVTVTAMDSLGAQTSAALSITINPTPLELLVSSGSMGFLLKMGASSTPPVQRLTVASSVVANALAYTATMTPAVTWLNVSGGLITPGVMNVSLTSAALVLAEGKYQTSIAIVCTTAGCSGTPHNVTVNLTVAPSPGKLVLGTIALSFSADASAPTASMTKSIELSNTGGLSAAITAVSCGAAWCSVGAYPASLGGGAETEITVTANPSGLTPGFYQTSVSVQQPTGLISAPVTLLVPKPATMLIAPGGATLSMQTGGALGTNGGSFSIVATGGFFTWTAAATSNPAWLALNNSSGLAAPGAPGAVSYTINQTLAASLATGVYYGSIIVTAPGTANTTQQFRVVLDVTSTSNPVKPEPQPAGLQFLTQPGLKPASQSIRVAAGSTATVKYQVAATTTSGGSWLSISPTSGSTSSASADITTVSANAAGLSPGVYNGTVSYALSAFGVRTVDVTLVVVRPGSTVLNVERGGLQPADSQASGSCAPTTLAITQTALPNGFSENASWPLPLTAGLVDDCGSPVNNGLVLATFSNGDPPLSLDLSDNINGIYSGTWTPVNTAAQVTVNLHATAPSLSGAMLQLQGAVKSNLVPVLNPGGTANAYSSLSGQSLAPGTVVAIYGSNLASTSVQPAGIPLTTAAAGATVLIGGIAAPLYYVSPGQINAMVPFELNPNSEYQIVISSNGALTMPDKLETAPVSPGVAAGSDGTVIAQHSDGVTLITDKLPAAQGETIVLYIVGMGATSPGVASGNASPSGPPFAPALVAPTVTIGGQTAQVVYAGLTPGSVGLYQINAVVPANAPDGDQALIVSQNGVATNLASLPVQ